MKSLNASGGACKRLVLTIAIIYAWKQNLDRFYNYSIGRFIFYKQSLNSTYFNKIRNQWPSSMKQNGKLAECAPICAGVSENPVTKYSTLMRVFNRSPSQSLLIYIWTTIQATFLHE